MKLMHVSKLFTSQQWRELKLISYLTENSNAFEITGAFVFQRL